MDFTKVKANLEKLGYTVSCFDTASEAAEYLDSAIDNASVGIGGSLTIEQMGVYDSICILVFGENYQNGIVSERCMYGSVNICLHFAYQTLTVSCIARLKPFISCS